MQAVQKQATLPANMALSTSFDIVGRRWGAIMDIEPSVIPMAPKFEKPHKAYVAMISDLFCIMDTRRKVVLGLWSVLALLCHTKLFHQNFHKPRHLINFPSVIKYFNNCKRITYNNKKTTNLAPFNYQGCDHCGFSLFKSVKKNLQVSNYMLSSSCDCHCFAALETVSLISFFSSLGERSHNYYVFKI